MKVVSLPALRTDRLYLAGDISGSHLLEDELTPWIMSMKNRYDPIGNRTRDITACR